jgi:uncharacterized membrane protein
MVEYERARRVDAPPDDVFAFVTDVRNLPAFVPTVRSAAQPAEERVRVRGETSGGTFEDVAAYHVDPSRRRLEWEADDRRHGGWLTVSPLDGASEVVVHLSFGPAVDVSGRPLTSADVEQPNPIEENLETALDSLRHLMEGTDGAEAPGAAG